MVSCANLVQIGLRISAWSAATDASIRRRLISQTACSTRSEPRVVDQGDDGSDSGHHARRAAAHDDRAIVDIHKSIRNDA